MQSRKVVGRRSGRASVWLLALLGLGVFGGILVGIYELRARHGVVKGRIAYEPRMPLETSGFTAVLRAVGDWPKETSLEEIAARWRNIGLRTSEQLDQQMARGGLPDSNRIRLLVTKAMLLHSEGETEGAYKALEQARALAEKRDELAARWLPAVIYYQGVTALRRGENENCIMCRGASSCILPIDPAARHTLPAGSRRAIEHFSEYLRIFPEDLGARWLLNLAHMTLGEHPDRVDSRYLIPLDRWEHSEFDIGRFADIGERAGVNRFNQGGGAILEDFDNDGRLDLAVTGFDPTLPMAIYHNSGDGTFADRTQAAGVADQLGGLYCVQTDYNNDGWMDIFIVRGAWLSSPIRPSLLRNNGDGTFTDVTVEAGLAEPGNSISATWADYDNDGWLDLFVCCEHQPNRLYHNRGDGTFEDVAAAVGLAGRKGAICKGAAWLDFDNDDDPDLFLTNIDAHGELYENVGEGRFRLVSDSFGVNGPQNGFSCWAWDYDNDGWLDIFATSYDRSLGDVVKGLIGEPHARASNALYHNEGGRRFVDVVREAGLDMVFATMGSNFGDFDNDGYLDMYLATGDPSIDTLVPNRMFKNVGGRRFAEITGSTHTGHLQKGHGVSCADWDRDGDVDLFVESGGAVNGDRYHNLLFENPGQGNHWLTLKLVGVRTNRPAIGARIKVVTAGESPLTVHRHISSGSSFGANPMQQTVGLAGATRIATLEIHWPASGTTQVFHDLAADQAIEVTEFQEVYRPLDWQPIRPAP